MNNEPCFYTLAYSTAATSQCPSLAAGTKGELIAESDVNVVLRFPNVEKSQEIPLNWTVEGRKFAGLCS